MAEIKDANGIIDVYVVYNKQLIRLAQSYFKDSDQIVNVIHDAVIDMIERQLTYPNEFACYAYMCQAVRSFSLNIKRNKHFDIPLQTSYVESFMNEMSEEIFPYDRFETAEYLKSLVTEYQPEIIEAFIVNIFDGIPSKRLAAQLGIKHDSLRRQFSRMKRKLKRLASKVYKELF